ncbi:TetR/AcrR family transcriptional regulator [Aquibacillus rhizosphaerae]|uniref:TetR/AcrR family transcriptional regulator n=1 Tax=Aquibacillus rhizosphaerae TaxID=3051431 RepID=A0ABT7KZF6_9BACI|nr:TetR/AcrR family transcriptional regulator [Aquibacillus sp. LR5S19]MDL4838878.1 TetR/AcrR family transcriptional regulator [Aquibacillus sp. LR5S19]
MNEKKKKIIEVSMILFAQKGFHATSIQEIATQSNVSKGAFYLYFNSKDELAMSIFKYYSNLILEKVEEIRRQNHEPKQKLTEQINVFLEMLSNHKEYIIMHFRDNLQLGEQFDEIILQMNKFGLQWTSENMKEIYGPSIEPYLVDASIQLDGILQGYFKWLVMHDIQVDTMELAAFIVRRLDDSIQGMLNSGDRPQINMNQLTYYALKCEKTGVEKVQQLLVQMIDQIHNQSISSEEKQQLLEAADVINGELEKKQPKKIIIQGMLTHLQSIPELKQSCEEIAKIIEIPLLSKE